ncbi:TIE2-like protein [Mya arenaria]|uniref:TIE2-like protein n=1 Tax=Mya arenaria TaxID=6604 RepID=A0ABY7F3G5_MYAAR|nr:TIE2-like protein [Mya arenaria]
MGVKMDTGATSVTKNASTLIVSDVHAIMATIASVGKDITDSIVSLGVELIVIHVTKPKDAFLAKEGYCHECVPGQYGPMCEQSCPKMCNTCKNETNCVSCNGGFFGESCKKQCPDGCKSNTCRNKDGSCFTCKHGYFGKSCGSTCPESCQKLAEGGIFHTLMDNVTNVICIASIINAIRLREDVFKDAIKGTGIKHVTKSVIQNVYIAIKQMDLIETEKQNWSIAALGVGIAGGVVVLAAIVVVGLFFLRRRRVNLKIISKAHEKEPENVLEMYAKVNNGRTTRAENAKGDTDNYHSVTVIGMPNYQSPSTNWSGNERTPILTEDNLEIGKVAI